MNYQKTIKSNIEDLTPDEMVIKMDEKKDKYSNEEPEKKESEEQVPEGNPLYLFQKLMDSRARLSDKIKEELKNVDHDDDLKQELAIRIKNEKTKIDIKVSQYSSRFLKTESSDERKRIVDDYSKTIRDMKRMLKEVERLNKV